jgi:hypothetical protein
MRLRRAIRTIAGAVIDAGGAAFAPAILHRRIIRSGGGIPVGPGLPSTLALARLSKRATGN